ncbi:MAG: NADPH:quinone oxidoreductase family protein [Alphaproteobacteria bacterium]|nr:MAG: NADPH:quinone oxidoreductase family protein [Alphaproteobacteria bacterium]
MKAVVCTEYGGPEKLQILDLPVPELKPGHVRLDLVARGVAFPDTLVIQGKYQIQPEVPFVPGGEVAGVVTEVADDVAGISVGDEVLAGIGHGGWTEQAVTEASRCVPVPDGMDMTDAAGYLMNHGTSYYALKVRGQLQPGETLLVTGAAGGVGLAAVQLGKLMGARVIAAASSDEKLALCKEHGADELINYSDGELKEKVKAVTGGKGADVIYDPVGGDLFDQCLRCINWNGRLLIIGFADGRIPTAPANLPLLKGCSLVGVFYGRFKTEEPEASAALTQELVDMYREGKVRPHISLKLPFTKAAEAVEIFNNRAVLGKIILTNES